MIACVLLAILACLTVVSSTAQHRALSPIDEYMYVDYAVKIPTEGFVRQGEETGHVAREYMSCLGTQIFGVMGTCGKPGKDAAYPYSGETISDPHPPTYFWTVWYGGRVFHALGVSDLLAAMRLTGAIYLALGAVGMYLLSRLARGARSMSFGLSLLAMSVPSVYWATHYISNDAPALALGAGVGILGLLAWRGRISAWWLVPASFVAACFKTQFAAPGGVVFAFVLLAFLLGDTRYARLSPALRSTARRMLLPSGLGVVASLVAVLGWSIIRARASIGPSANLGIAQPLNVSAFVSEALKFLPGAVSQTSGVNTWVINMAVASLAGAALLIAVLAVALGPRLRSRVFSPSARLGALAVLVGSLALGPVLAVAVSVGGGAYYALPARYGLSIVPFMGAVAALYWSASPRAARIIVPALGVVGYLSVLLSI